jgi:transposase
MSDIEKRTDAHVIEVARELDSQIRQLAQHAHVVLEALAALVKEARASSIHEALGFPSWTAYIADALDGQWKLERDKRGEIVRYLAGQGMSQRAIAKMIGASKGTVHRELQRVPQLWHVIGLDGRTHPRPEPGGPSGARDEEYDEEFLARLHAERDLHAEREASGGRYTMPATPEAAIAEVERIVEEKRRLGRLLYKMEIAALPIRYSDDGFTRDAKWVGLTLRRYGQLVQDARDNGMTIEEFCEKWGVSVYEARDWLGALHYVPGEDDDEEEAD